jgi:hypothetical protein
LAPDGDAGRFDRFSLHRFAASLVPEGAAIAVVSP